MKEALRIRDWFVFFHQPQNRKNSQRKRRLTDGQVPPAVGETGRGVAAGSNRRMIQSLFVSLGIEQSGSGVRQRQRQRANKQ